MRKFILKTKIIGKDLYDFDEVDSTNIWLTKEAFSLSNGAVVVAACQTAGKGRLGRHWEDAPGQALCCSVLLKELKGRALSLLPVFIALAVRRSLFLTTGVQPDIKWPNDVLLQGKKICGILCEAFPEEEGMSAVCGIGVNLIQNQQYFQERNLNHAGSLLTQTGKFVEREEVLPVLLEQLEEVLGIFEKQGFAPLREEYRKGCVNLGKDVLVLQGGNQRQGFAVDIDEEGRLICRFGNQIEAVSSGEVSVRGLYGYGE